MKNTYYYLFLLTAVICCSCEPQDPAKRHIVAVDMGLSVKWASVNVGAEKPEDYGDYYAWGETENKSTYNWSTYTLCNGSYSTMTKYCTSLLYGTVDNKTVLNPEDDVAQVKLGGKWRMPTFEEWRELLRFCDWTWTTLNGVNGRLVTSRKTGNSIFLPAAGYCYDVDLFNAGSDGYYWCSIVSSSTPYTSSFAHFTSSHVSCESSTSRDKGLSVRPVCEY